MNTRDIYRLQDWLDRIDRLLWETQIGLRTSEDHDLGYVLDDWMDYAVRAAKRVSTPARNRFFGRKRGAAL